MADRPARRVHGPGQDYETKVERGTARARSIAMSDDDFARLDALAARWTCSRSEAVRRAVRAALETAG